MRVVICGAGGFIGKSLKCALEKLEIPVLGLTRAEVDLTAEHASTKLAALLKSSDTLLFVATVTPDRGKGIEAFYQNITIGKNVSQALEKVMPAHVVYLSSDTVYALNRGVISESSPGDPENLFGIMHLSREYMLKSVTTSPLAILRSTLVYGADDTHNSYGPNRLWRQAVQTKRISLFGQGEEMRDHISIHDVVDLTLRVLQERMAGILNLATGSSISYFELAQMIQESCEGAVEIVCNPRATPITHRHFDATLVYKTFPSFSFRSLKEGLQEAYNQFISKV